MRTNNAEVLAAVEAGGDLSTTLPVMVPCSLFAKLVGMTPAQLRYWANMDAQTVVPKPIHRAGHFRWHRADVIAFINRERG